jgi:hypothetical protein
LSIGAAADVARRSRRSITTVILCRRDGERLDRRTAHRWIRSIGKRAGLGLVHPHMLRAAFIMAALESPGDNSRDASDTDRHLGGRFLTRRGSPERPHECPPRRLPPPESALVPFHPAHLVERPNEVWVASFNPSLDERPPTLHRPVEEFDHGVATLGVESVGVGDEPKAGGARGGTPRNVRHPTFAVFGGVDEHRQRRMLACRELCR